MSLFLFCILLVIGALAKDPDYYRNTVEMIMARGFTAETHTIKTSDGYLMYTFRIPGKKGQPLPPQTQAILLNSGIICSSDQFLVNGNKSLPYYLADLGYDVWLMNNRGTRYGRNHTHIDPDNNPKFWEFTFHDMGVIDIHDNIEYIKNVTKGAPVSYLGFSQGGAEILAAMAEDPYYYKTHLRSVVLWGPVSNMEHSNNLLKLVYWSFTFYVLEFLGMREYMPYSSELSSFTSVFCKLNPAICSFGLALIADSDPEADNQEKWEVFMSHYPAGSSMLAMIHLMELMMYKGFVKHRKTVFHSVEAYKLNDISDKVPIALITGKKDLLVSVEDCRWLKNKLNETGALKFYKEYETMGHMTYVIPSPKAEAFLQDTIDFIKSHQLSPT